MNRVAVAIIIRERWGRFTIDVDVGHKSARMYYRPAPEDFDECAARIGERVRVAIENGRITDVEPT